MNKTNIEFLEIRNFKNVEYGMIDLRKNDEVPNRLVGIYGQNGSGKTTVINVLKLLKTIFSNSTINSFEFLDSVNKDIIGEINIGFIFNNKTKIRYVCKIKKYYDEEEKKDKLSIIQEEIYVKTLKKSCRERQIIKIDTEKTKEEFMKIASSITKKKIENNIDTMVTFLKIKELSKSFGKSFIFNREFLKVFKEFVGKDKDNEFIEIVDILCLFENNLFIYTNDYSGITTANIILPLCFSINKGNAYHGGIIALPIYENSDPIDEKLYKIAELIFDQINKVLPKLIPGLKLTLSVIDTKIVENKTTGELEKGYVVSIISNRYGKEFPFRAESDGIKKIVSILSAIISVYNDSGIIVAIDELDAGIYEFLLGEIVSILDKDMKGQLFFTSHNLRALEMVDYGKIIFTTTNPNKRYIEAPKLKKTNNLRDVYIRAIKLGGMEEELYEETDDYEIKKAFGSVILSEVKNES